MNLRIAGLLAIITLGTARAEEQWVTYKGGDGPGAGKHIVLISGDEEYRSEEALPQLGKILARHHGFTCTVLFAIDPSDGTINPNVNNNIPGLEALQKADLMIIATRFRNLPDAQMKHVVDYVASGRSIIGLRTATHAFNLDKNSSFRQFSYNAGGDWSGGFGRQILGETWISHHGHHKVESCRGVIPENVADHPILRGIKTGDIWGPTDVYGVRLPLPGDSKPLVLGAVLKGMKPDDPPVEGKKNNPMMPIAWTKSYTTESGKTGLAFTTTMGASQDLESAGLRRLLVNATYWALGLEEKIPSSGTMVDIVGEYQVSPYSFNAYRKGVKPADHALKN